MTDLIRVTQLPVIEERLRSMQEQVKARTDEAMSMVCTPDTLTAVKAVRADLNKDFTALEEQRKAVKKAVMGPYEAFEAVYKECVSDAFREADVALKGKIGAVEADLKGRVEQEAKDYFFELCQAEHVEWLSWGQAGITVSMTDARQKTHKSLREKITTFVTGVARGVEAISGMEDAEEILAEFKHCLDAATAIRIVQERHERIEDERRAAEARRAAIEAQKAAVEKVEAIAPPTVLEPPVAATAAQEKVYKCSFTVRATKEQLKRLKEFMVQEGIRYE